MKPPSIKVEFDEPGADKAKATVTFHEGDTATTMGKSADIVIYIPVDTAGRSPCEVSREVGDMALAEARRFLRDILHETD